MAKGVSPKASCNNPLLLGNKGLIYLQQPAYLRSELASECEMHLNECLCTYLFTNHSSLSPQPSSHLLAWVSKNLCKIMWALGQLHLMDPMVNEFLRTFCQVSRYMRPQPWPTSFFQCLEDHRAAHPSKVYLGPHGWSMACETGLHKICKRILWCIWLQIVGQLNDKQMHGWFFMTGSLGTVSSWDPRRLWTKKTVLVGSFPATYKKVHAFCRDGMNGHEVQDLRWNLEPYQLQPRETSQKWNFVLLFLPKLRKPTKNSGISNGRMTASLMARLASSNPPMSSKRTCQVKWSWANKTACEIGAVML